jgi:lysozyme
MDRTTATILGGLGVLGLFLVARASASEPTGYGDTGSPDDPGPPPLQPSSADLFNADNVDAQPVESLSPSPQLIAWLKGKESLSLSKYTLGDGGVTIGYGHYEPFGPKADALPAQITQAQAEQMFADDLQARAVVWVQKYVFVPLTQNQFDALVSLAYNLSPHSFSQIADSVNNGNGIGDAATQTGPAYDYIRAGTNLEAGLRARRNAEVAMFDSGNYA